jgi:iron complex outermembrane recepter protein
MRITINSAHLKVQLRLITSASALAVLAATSFQPDIALAGDAASANKPDTTLEEIVVTAERRTVNLQDTNLAASSLGAVELEKKSVTEIADLQNTTPSLSVIDQGFSHSVNIRGIGLAVASPQVAPGIATYRDGVFLPTQTSLGLPFYDLQDVEVLRGPQGTFAGQDATGGAVFVNSKSPTLSDHVSGDLTAAYGNYNDVLLQGAVNLPISDTLAARVAFLDEKRNSFYKDISPTANGLQPGRLDTMNLRIGLLWKPTDELSVLFKTEYDQYSNDSYAFQPIPGTAFYDAAPKTPFVIDYDAQGLRNDEDYILSSLQINYAFADGITLKSNSGYQYNGTKAFYDPDASPVPFETETQNFIERIWTEDLSLVSPDTGPLRWVVGGTYFNYTIPLDVIESLPLVGETVHIAITSPKKSYGIFGSATYNILPTLELQGGLRYSGDTVGQGGGVSFATSSGIPLGFLGETSPNYNDNAWTGKVALNWKAGADDLLYVFWAKGYKSGGTNGAGADFAPETVYDYETGWKSTMLNGHLRTQLDAFYMQYQNFQVNEFDPVVAGSAITNAGATSTIKGFEAQSQLQLGAFGADANLSYVHSNIGSLPNQVDTRTLPNGSATGLGAQCTAPAAPNPTPCFNYTPFSQPVPNGPNIYSPKWSANAGIQYEFNMGSAGTLTPRADVSYMGEQWATFFEAPEDKLSARTLINLHLTYQHDDWTVQGYATNVANKVYVSGFSFDFGNNYFLLPPRQFGMRVTRRF